MPAVATITPPSSSHGGGRDSWSMAVPLNHQDYEPHSDLYNPKAYMSNDVSVKAPYYSRHQVHTQPNSLSRPPRRRAEPTDSAHSSHGKPVNDVYLAPSRLDATSPNSSGVSANGSDPDSLLDMYSRNQESRQGSHGIANGANGGSRKVSHASHNSEAGDEERYWIHRDKLLQIEHQELAAAGFLPPKKRNSRSGSRSSSHSRAHSKRDASAKGEDRAHHKEDKKQRMISPIPAAEEEEQELQYDTRSPEQIAAEREHILNRANPTRPGTSRIPVAKASPAPVPHNFVERDHPLPRSRSGSGAWSGTPGEGIVYPGRKRGGSVGSQVLLDDMTDPGSQSPDTGDSDNSQKGTRKTSSSPRKAKVPGKANPTSGARKASTPRGVSGTKPRATSTSQKDSARPRTSSGRPTTGQNRPEGEAPWIATMYKPDPRLPPEEQMLPTHAKRMAQEQWEKEGQTGNVYDKDFRLLNAHDFARPEQSSADVPTLEGQEDRDQYQLQPEKQEQRQEQKQSQDREQVQEDNPKQRPLSGAWPLAGSANPKRLSAMSGHGEFKLTPTISSPPVPTTTTIVSGPSNGPSPKPESIRIPDMSEKESGKPKKSCGCCVVM
ncbi:hypothetical protein K490DRAFT_53199 [Saccharata proteae CBS 121410]|uniref:Pal1-domain-containing protein n=1 Tax=Saccharata proteae CBS 121410 TaxID=1314787 RepID=A0A9P4I3Z5_9PEZI|nr:hypothetical protein K490DRAFT_53199 [Saccharata proteae CBS 121410]